MSAYEDGLELSAHPPHAVKFDACAVYVRARVHSCIIMSLSERKPISSSASAKEWNQAMPAMLFRALLARARASLPQVPYL